MGLFKTSGSSHIRRQKTSADTPVRDQTPQVDRNKDNIIQLANDLYATPSLDGDTLPNLITDIETQLQNQLDGTAAEVITGDWKFKDQIELEDDSGAAVWKLENEDGTQELVFAKDGLERIRLGEFSDVTFSSASPDIHEFIIIRSTDVSGSGDAGLNIEANNGSAQWQMFLDNSDGDDLKFRFNSSSRVEFDSSTGGIRVIGGNTIQIIPTNITSGSTPADNTLYANLVPKAWARTDDNGNLQDGVNLSVSRSSTGVYAYSFRNSMAGSNNYAAVTTALVTTGQNEYETKVFVGTSAGGFTVGGLDGTDPTFSTNERDIDHTVIVMGEQ